jgi:hypothetical protein
MKTLIGTMLIAGLLLVSPAWGWSYDWEFSDGFETVPGVVPGDTVTDADPANPPWRTTRETLPYHVQVYADAAGGNGTPQYCDMKRDGAGAGSLDSDWEGFASYLTDKNFQVSADIKVGNTVHGFGMFGVGKSYPGPPNMIACLGVGMQASAVHCYYPGYTRNLMPITDYLVEGATDAIDGNWHNYLLVANIAGLPQIARNFDLYIDGSLVAVGLPLYDSSMTVPGGAMINSVQSWTHTGHLQAGYKIDNVNLDAPEPATMALLMLGLPLLRRRK